MNIYQQTALQEYLTDFPCDVTYEQILVWLEKGDDRVIVWEPFERYRGVVIARYIENLKDTLERNFIPKEQEQ